jgi:hypothetical protein
MDVTSFLDKNPDITYDVDTIKAKVVNEKRTQQTRLRRRLAELTAT